MSFPERARARRSNVEATSNHPCPAQVGYARSIAQRVARTGRTRTPFYWSVDDNVVRFQKWVRQASGKRREAREPTEGFSRYLEAFLFAQTLPDASDYAEIGFLRQRGTACRSVRTFAANVLSMYKCVLLNDGLLEARDLRYNPALSRFEDIALTAAALDRGLKTLKCYDYAYVAANLQSGGCADLRFHLRGDHGLARDDVAEPLEKTGPLETRDEDEVSSILRWVTSWVSKEEGDEETIFKETLVEVGAEADELGDADFADRDWAPSKRCGRLDLDQTTFKTPLLPHQWKAVSFLRDWETHAALRTGTGARGGVLADEPGLGKTIVALAVVALDDVGGSRTLVVAPKSVVHQWLTETRSHLGESDAAAIASPDDLDGDDDASSSPSRHVVRVCTYAFAVRHAALLLHQGAFKRVVFDEAHCLRNEKTKRHEALAALAKRTKIVHCLTGTPVVNSSSDVASLFRVLGYDGPKPTRKGLLGLSRHLMLRRRRCDPAPDGGPLVRLPPVKEEDLVEPFVSETEKQRYDDLLRRAQDELRAAAPGGLAASNQRAAALVYLQKLCLACLFDADVADAGLDLEEVEDDDDDDEPDDLMDSDDDGSTSKLKRRRVGAPPLAASTKLRMLGKVLDRPSTKRPLVFSRFRTFLRAAEDATAAAGAYVTVRIDGSVSSRDRAAAARRFQCASDDRKVALFITIGAGGEGLNLASADTVVLCEPYWNQPVEDQAVARAHRIGRAGPLSVVRLHVAGTVEVPIAKLKADKAKEADAFYDRDETAPDANAFVAKSKSLSIAQLRTLFDLDPDVAT